MDALPKYIDRGIKYSFYALFFFGPLFLYPRTFELFEFNKLWLTLGLSVVILFLWVSKMILTKRVIFKRTPLDIPIGLFLVSQIISTFWSIDPYVSFWGYYSRFNGGLVSIISYIFLYYAFVSNFSNTSRGVAGPREDIETFKPKFFAAGLLSFIVLLFMGFLTQSLSFLQDFFMILTGGAAFVFFAKAFDFSPVKKLFAFILTSGLIVALWGFPSHFGYDPTCILFRGTFNVSCWTDAFQPTVRLFSTLGQPNWLAAYFSILIPLTLAIGFFKFLQRDENKKINLPIILFSVFSILLFIEVLWTQSQSGLLGLGIGLTVFFLGIIFLSLKSSKYIKKETGKAIIGMIAVFFLISFLLGSALASRFPLLSLNGALQEFSHKTVSTTKAAAPVTSEELGGSDSGKIRLVVWHGAFDIFKAHPLFGTGVETFAYAYYQVKPKEHNLLSEWDYLYNKAHNEYLNYLATTGIFGLGTYLLMIGWFLVWTARHLLSNRYYLTSKNSSILDHTSSLLPLAFLAGYISILVSNFFGFSVVIVNTFFFIIPGFILVLWDKPHKDTELIFEPTPIRVTGIFITGIILLYVEFFLLRFWLADQKYSMGYNLDRAQQYVAANQYLEDAAALAPQEDLYKNELSLNLVTLGVLLSEQKQGSQADDFINRGIDMANTVIENHPHNIVFYKTRVQLLFELSTIQPAFLNKALDAIKTAETLAPTDAKLAYNEGLLYVQKEDFANADKAFKKSIYLKPNYRDPRFALATFAVQEAKKEKDSAKKQEFLTIAKNNLNYILLNIDPNDTKSKDLLNSLQ